MMITAINYQKYIQIRCSGVRNNTVDFFSDTLYIHTSDMVSTGTFIVTVLAMVPDRAYSGGLSPGLPFPHFGMQY